MHPPALFCASLLRESRLVISEEQPARFVSPRTSHVAKGDAHLYKRLWLKREQENETTCGVRGREGHNSRTERLPGADALRFVSSRDGAKLCRLQSVGSMSPALDSALQGHGRADLWLGTYPSSRSYYEDEPSGGHMISHARACPVCAKQVKWRRSVTSVCLNSNIFLIWCRAEAHLTSFLIVGSSSFFMPSHAAKAR